MSFANESEPLPACGSHLRFLPSKLSHRGRLAAEGQADDEVGAGGQGPRSKRSPVPGTPRPHYRGWMDAPAVRSPRIRRAAVCMAVVVLAADQISKALVVAGALRGSRGGLVSVRLVRNTGASFGIGAGASGAYHGGRRGRPRRRRHLAGADPQAGCGAVPGRGGRGCGGQPRRPAAAVTGTRPGCGGGLDSCCWLPSHVRSRGRGRPRRERPGASWRRWPRAAGQHAARQPRGAASFAGERYDAADRAQRADDSEFAGRTRPATGGYSRARS